jgi:PAN domain
MLSRVALLCGAIVGATLLCGFSANSAITVDARDDIFLAGQDTVPTNFPYEPHAGGAGAGLLPVSVRVSPGENLILTARGSVSCCYNVPPHTGPDGVGGTVNIPGFGNVGAYLDSAQLALVGVFGGPGIPKPWRVFRIGSSYRVTVPDGATTLYLGFADAFEANNVPGYYNDNTGVLTVTIAVANPPVQAPSSTSSGSTVESGTDRYGNDYRIFNVPPENFGACLAACQADAHCQAWSYESSNAQRTNGVCWLKNPAPAPVAKQITTSGVMLARLGQPTPPIAPISNSGTFVTPVYNGYRLDWCRIFETECGAPAADAFCKGQGFSGVGAFKFQPNPGVATMTIGQNSVCDPQWHGCDSFEFVRCR